MKRCLWKFNAISQKRVGFTKALTKGNHVSGVLFDERKAFNGTVVARVDEVHDKDGHDVKWASLQVLVFLNTTVTVTEAVFELAAGVDDVRDAKAEERRRHGDGNGVLCTLAQI